MKVMLSDGKRYLTGMLWRQVEHPALKPDASVNIVFRPDLNTYNGNTEVQAIIQAAELA